MVKYSTHYASLQQVFWFQICLHGVDCAAFLAVMEYLYTDNCSSLSEVPVEDVLILADRLCLSRLVQMCEVRMRDEFQQMAQTQNCRDLLENVLDILEFSTVKFRFVFVCTVAHNCHGNTKSLAAKTKLLTEKPNCSRQNQKGSQQNQKGE